MKQKLITFFKNKIFEIIFLKPITHLVSYMVWDVYHFKSNQMTKINFSALKSRFSSLPLIGSGSSRIVFDNGDTVIKVAKNTKGIAQNEQEVLLTDDYMAPAIAKVLEVGEGFIVAEKAQKLNSKDFLRITGITWKVFCDNLFDKEWIDNDFYSQIRDYSVNFDVPLSELRVKSAYGILNDEIVLVDYGFNNEISKKYYGK